LARKILLADDSVTAQNMGRKILADAGYDVVTVNNGSAALKRVAEIKPDLIVLDVYMPGYSGLEVCQRLKDAPETSHIPVLLTVGKLEPFKPEEARRVRADAHIVKPFEASELLTAITRLEDGMVPQQADGGRFNASTSGLSGDGGGKTENAAETETGWKSRLRFPLKRKKEETEKQPEESAVGASFRDFRKAKGKTAAPEVFAAKASAAPLPEAALVPDIPRDITPEELDALSALAEKLDGTILASENVATQPEIQDIFEAPVVELAVVATDETEAGVADVPVSAAEETAEIEASASSAAPAVVEPTPVLIEAPQVAIEALATSDERKNELEIPVQHVELGSEVVANPITEETHQPEAQHLEAPTAHASVEVNAALFAQNAEPVDRDDEPMFALAASAIAQAFEEKIAEENIEQKPAEPVAATVTELTAATDPESRVEETGLEESKPGNSENIELPVTVAAAGSIPEVAPAEEPPPSDEELAEALRLLTPSCGQGNFSAIPSREMLAATGQLLAEEAARFASANPRWIAEPVMLTPQEAASSLEAEMFRTMAETPTGEIDLSRLTGVSAIAAAVENRLAAAELAANINASAEPAAEPSSSGTGEQNSESGSESRSESAVEESAVKVVTTATLAAVVAKDEDEALVSQNNSSENSASSNDPADDTLVAVPTVEEDQDSSSDSGGRESMGKDVKSKSGKSNGRQIGKAQANPGARNDVSEVMEAPNQAEIETENQKAMAAAASEGSPSASVPDASTIASIVDSVMADLRPRIVEEIARKLAGK
jgi:CheY-like chemotaxis protein